MLNLNLSNFEYYLENKKNLSKEDLIQLRNFIMLNESLLMQEYPVVSSTIEADKIFVISDLHLGSKNENMDDIEEAFENANKEGIKDVLILGDIIQGSIRHEEPLLKNKTDEELLELYASRIEKLPKDDSFRIKAILGNHDLSMIYGQIIDMSDLLGIFSSRTNIEILGIKKVIVDWSNTSKALSHKISLNHEIETIKLSTHEDVDLELYGHSHKFYVKDHTVHFPSLSDDYKGGTDGFTGYSFIEMTEEGMKVDSFRKIKQLGIVLHDNKTVIKRH